MEVCKRTDSEKFLRRRLLARASRTLSFLALAGLAVFTARVQPQPADPVTPSSGTDLLRAFLDETRTLRAMFEQTLLGAGGEVLERATGDLSIARPGRFAWHYIEPIDQLVVADGQNLWIYDAELAQATVTPLDEATRASPAMLLSGDATLDEEFEVRESFEAENLTWVRLAPRPRGTDFKEILIGFEATTLRRLELLDSLDQVTSLEFFGVETNGDIADAVFSFVPPSGVDVIGEPG